MSTVTRIIMEAERASALEVMTALRRWSNKLNREGDDPPPPARRGINGGRDRQHPSPGAQRAGCRASGGLGPASRVPPVPDAAGDRTARLPARSRWEPALRRRRPGGARGYPQPVECDSPPTHKRIRVNP
jgi:hypothetical protein